MAWIFGEKKFGQYTYEHWYDHEYNENNLQVQEKDLKENKVSFNLDDNTISHKLPQQQ